MQSPSTLQPIQQVTAAGMQIRSPATIAVSPAPVAVVCIAPTMTTQPIITEVLHQPQQQQYINDTFVVQAAAAANQSTGST